MEEAKWICPDEFACLVPVETAAIYSDRSYTPDMHYANKHILYKKEITVQNTSHCTVNITADDYYKLYINGVFVGMGPAPSYNFKYNYNTYDISPFLLKGKNQIFVHTYYQGLVNRVHCSGDLRQGLWAEFFCENELIASTDEAWQYAYDSRFGSAGYTGYRTQFTENINVSNDTFIWRYAKIKQYCDYTLTKQISQPCRVQEIKPESIVKLSQTETLFDFGKENCGCLKITGNGNEAGKIFVLFSEELENGHAKYKMRCNTEYKERWILDGKHDAENFDFKAFRYVEIQGNINPATVTLIRRQYPIKHESLFKSKNDTLNKIFDICKQAVLTSSQEVFMDCPTREKGQYSGDLTVTAVAHSYITGDTTLYKKALFDIADSSIFCKGFLCCAPCSFKQMIADYSLLFPYQLYKYFTLSSDTDTVKELLPYVDGMLNYFKQYRRPDGLLEQVSGMWNLVDWPSGLRDNYDFELTDPIGEGCHNVINAFYYGALRYTEKLSEITGTNKNYGSAKVLKVYNKAFFRPDFGLYADSETSNHFSLHSNALPLFFDMINGNKDTVVNHIMDKGLCCGVYFSYFVLKGLVFSGHKKEALSLMLNESEHSWVNMLKEGATTCFEAWGKEQKANTSLCHPWASAPVILLTEDFRELNMI